MFSLEGLGELIAPSDNLERFSQAINSTVQAVVPWLKSFHQLLVTPPKVREDSISLVIFYCLQC